MKLSEVLSKIDALKFNTYSPEVKIAWISNLDQKIKTQIIDLHEGGSDTVFNGYDENTDGDTVLLVPSPFDEIYLRWLEAMIDYSNGEYDKYNSAIQLYNTLYKAYANHYTRTHKPLSHGTRFSF